MRKNLTTVSRIVFLLYIAFLCIACFVKFEGNVDFSDTIFGIPKDKIVHFLMFLPFPPLMYSSFYGMRGKPWSLVLFLFITLVTGSIIAGGTEIIQGLTDYRSMDIGDFRADSTGLLTGCLSVMVYAAVWKKW